MTGRSACRLGALTLVVVAASPRLSAQVTTLVTNVVYQSPQLIAPAVVFHSSSASGLDAWTLGLVGYTLGVERSTTSSPTVSRMVRVEVTPFNSNSSQYVYRDGQRDADLEFRNRTVRLGAGLRLQHGRHWRTGIRAIGLYESVAALVDATVAEHWRKPYAGLGVEASYNHVVADDVFQARWDGLKLSGSAVGFVGSRTWWKGQVSLGAGKQVGRVMIRGAAWLLLGHHLDVVNQHLVGGCWDLAGSPSLYGYRYAEFRVDQAVVVSSGADLRLGTHWELGLRFGYLNSPTSTTYGEAVRLSTVWDGVGLHLGVGLPRAYLFQRSTAEPVLFAGISAGVL